MAEYNFKDSPAVAEAEVMREARRLFGRLTQKNAHLAPVNGDCYALHFGARLERRVAKVSAVVVDRFFINGWLAQGKRPRTFILSETGLGWLARSELVEGDPFVLQHQLRSVQPVQGPDGINREVTVNDGESPLGWLAKRGTITEAQFEAGDRFRRDYTMARLAPRLGVDLTAPVVMKSRNPSSIVPDIAIAAGQRFRAAMRLLGPGLSDLLFDICCALKGMEECERGRDWPRRSAKVVLCLGLDRLAAHYGIAVTAPTHAAIRTWSREGEGGG